MMLALAQLALVAGGLWRPVQPGVWQRDIRMAPDGPLSVVQAIAIRIDPSVVSFRLDTATRDFGMRGAWSIERMPADALVALNTGQFATGRPWGWLVRDGIEAQPPGHGSVAMAFVVDSAGRPALLRPDDIPAWRGRVSLAFQSYPALLIGDGEVPWEIRESGRGVDLEHRDSRLAIGVLGDGSVVLVLTRYTGLGGAAPTLPWGPTVPEMADVMKSLGARRALLLDGGVSSQLAVRRRDGSVARWENWRSVPVGMVVVPARP
jgi:exopolysaccharide biosynthesis protein